mmetsp:Transcript_11100/g.21745  ORF Transcript_11100/g.21745 Transcript_11100/m.21745 type:complete len:268 (+) Transcript_11100:62-865(+)
MSHDPLTEVQTFKPDFFNTILRGTCTLLRTDLNRGLTSQIQLTYRFNEGSILVEGEDGLLYVTGGTLRNTYLKWLDVINPTADFAVTSKTDMHNTRSIHGAAWYEGFLYVVGGNLTFPPQESDRRKCERYSAAEDRWEEFDSLSLGCAYTSVITLQATASLYAIGGTFGGFDNSDSIQRLSLDSLRWTVLEVKLPDRGYQLASFKLDEAGFYFVVEGTLYKYESLTDSIRTVKPLPHPIKSFCASSYYRNGCLYSADIGGCRVSKIA